MASAEPFGAPGLGPTWSSSAKDVVTTGARAEPAVGDRRSRDRERGVLAHDRRAADSRSRLHRRRRPRMVRGQARQPLHRDHAEAVPAASARRPRRRALHAEARVHARSAPRRTAHLLRAHRRRISAVSATGSPSRRDRLGQHGLGRGRRALRARQRRRRPLPDRGTRLHSRKRGLRRRLGRLAGLQQERMPDVGVRARDERQRRAHRRTGRPDRRPRARLRRIAAQARGHSRPRRLSKAHATVREALHRRLGGLAQADPVARASAH